MMGEAEYAERRIGSKRVGQEQEEGEMWWEREQRLGKLTNIYSVNLAIVEFYIRTL